jgi:hypothetical protein
MKIENKAGADNHDLVPVTTPKGSNGRFGAKNNVF